MSHCPDVDQLLSVANALDWQVQEGLEHLRECERCGDYFAQLASVHAVLEARTEPRAGFADEVMRSLPDAEPATRRWIATTLSVVNPALAAFTTLFVLGLAANSPTPLPFGTPIFVVVVLAAAVTAAWSRRTTPARS